MIIYKKDNLLEATEDIIAHGCNISGGFGSGVAGQIAKQWPFAREAYLKIHRTRGWSLGEVQTFHVVTPYKIISNCITQKEYLPRGVCHADYNAIRTCMETVKRIGKNSNQSIAIPKIGCGLAGGDWNVVKEILEDVFQDYDVTVYEL